MSISADALTAVPLLAGLSKRDRERLAATMTERTFSAGTEITREDQGGVGFFVIADGSATVNVDGEARRTLGPGDAFGEMALIDRGGRSANVVADSDLRCYAMTAWNFKPFVKDHPDVAWALLETLVKRLRDAEARTGA